MRGCQGCSRAGSPWIWTEMPVVQGCWAGWAGAGKGAVPLLVDSYPSSFRLHRMKRIPSGRRQKMGRRHEPPTSGLGVVGGPSGPGGGGGVGSAACNHSSPGSLLWAPSQSCRPFSPQPSHAAPPSSLPSSTSLPAPSELPSWSPVTPSLSLSLLSSRPSHSQPLPLSIASPS